MRPALLGLALLAACAHAKPSTFTLTVVGTNDLHGHVMASPSGRGGVAMFGGYVANLRHARAADGGGVLLVDAGDLFQGTMESNLNEGKAVIGAYNALGYAAAAVGNHEFDFGPVGPRVAPAPGDDPRGALKARASEATFPFLAANIIDESTGKTLFAPSAMVEVAGVKVGIIGVATWWTPSTTAEVTFRGLKMLPLADTIDAETRKLRAAGAKVILVAAHAGLCKRVVETDEVQICDQGEIADVVKALKEKVDVVIAGHTHAGVVLQLGDVPISEAWNYGRGFGRIDLTIDRKGNVLKRDLRQPQLMVPGSYEGQPVVADPQVAATIKPYVDAAADKRSKKLGVQVVTTVRGQYDSESPLGNLMADLLLAVRPKSDAAVSNGGSLRKELPAGELTYGQVFESYPFDNFVATVKMTGGDLRRVFERNLGGERGILTLAGMRLVATCEGGKLSTKLLRADGRPVADDEPITVVTSDFLAGGFEGSRESTKQGVNIEEGHYVREEIVDLLEKRGGTLDGNDPKIFDANRPRLAYPGKRPVTCP